MKIQNNEYLPRHSEFEWHGRTLNTCQSRKQLMLHALREILTICVRDNIITMLRKTDSSNRSVTCDGHTDGRAWRRSGRYNKCMRDERRVRMVVYVRYYNDKSDSNNAKCTNAKTKKWGNQYRELQRIRINGLLV